MKKTLILLLLMTSEVTAHELKIGTNNDKPYIFNENNLSKKWFINLYFEDRYDKFGTGIRITDNLKGQVLLEKQKDLILNIEYRIEY